MQLHITQRNSLNNLRRLTPEPLRRKESVVAAIAIWRPMSEQAAFLCAMSYVSAFSFPLSSSLPGYCDVVARKLQVLPFIRGALVRFRSFGGMPRVSVAKCQNLIPSFPWITPGWRAGAQSKERKGSNFAEQRSGAIVIQARSAKQIQS